MTGEQFIAFCTDRPGLGCDSSTGFVLPNGARRSPDASWTLKSRVQQLGAGKRKAFWHLCPDFVIEVKSASDRQHFVQTKMLEYLANGAKLGWLIDPENRSVEIYRLDGNVESRVEIDKTGRRGSSGRLRSRSHPRLGSFRRLRSFHSRSWKASTRSRCRINPARGFKRKGRDACEQLGAATFDSLSLKSTHCRGVAQPGSAPALGAGGREFKSHRPDQSNDKDTTVSRS